MAVTIADPTTMDNVGLAAGRVLGDVRVTCKRVTLDASYPTGGYTVTSLQLGLPGGRCLFSDTAQVAGNETTLISPWWDPATNQLKAYTDAGEVANATDLHTVVVQILAYGF